MLRRIVVAFPTGSLLRKKGALLLPKRAHVNSGPYSALELTRNGTTSRRDWSDFSTLTILLSSRWYSSLGSVTCSDATVKSKEPAVLVFDHDTILPPNLTFDRKSSFAPKVKPLLVVPTTPASSTTAASVATTTIPIDSNDGDGSENEMESTKLATTAKVDDDAEEEEGEELEDYDDHEMDDVELASRRSGSVRKVIPLPDRLHQTIYHGPDGSKSGTIWLNESVFGIDPIRIDLIKQNVDYIRNKIRGVRKAKSKTISEVSGSGRKVRQQKGTGRARAGHSRPAHWRGGAKAHGPKNTVDYGNVKLNKKAKALAMRSMLSQKVKEGNLILVDHFKLPSHKTKTFSKNLEEQFGIGKHEGGTSALILDHHLESDEEASNQNSDSFHASYRGVPINLWVASSNIFKVKVANQRFANVYDILKREKLVLTLSALEQIESRWKEE